VRELALTPRWIAGALFCLAGAAVCAFLGVWQWNSAESLHGTLQNLAYAFNWWLFAALFIGFWFKALRDTVRRDAAEAAGTPIARGLGPVPKPVRVREPAPDVPRPPLPTAEEDPDVAAWNRWLAELNANPSR
jgi:DNA-binding transcriptional regulator of glucitol operon